jgi:hypothetical protein
VASHSMALPSPSFGGSVCHRYSEANAFRLGGTPNCTFCLSPSILHARSALSIEHGFYSSSLVVYNPA